MVNRNLQTVDPALGGEETVPRTGRRLLDATRPFAVEDPLKSWWSAASTLIVLVAVLVIAAVAPWWPVRLLASVVGGLLMVRSFILYHDFMHNALLRDSIIAKPVFYLVGLLLLTPPRYWRYSHNFHHGNVGKPLHSDANSGLLVTSDLGSFPLMTTETWGEISSWQRLRYRINRHALTLACAYVTVFLFSLTLQPFLKSPRKYWDGAISVVAHGALLAGLWVLAGFWVLFFAFLLPFAIASALGAYLFYAQHNYEGMRILKPEEWTYYRGAIESSSYMKLGPVIDWFTGNIGYHHAHHMNPLIPFYRLPEVIAAVPELQDARETSLRPRDIIACLRLNLWDAERRELVRFGEANHAA
jgi:omega-6 fatty acid desaturase (delta-12 desaturase)